MLYMILESYKDGDPIPVYRRLRDRGRSLPAGLEYRGSWITEDLTRCFQVMECDDRAVLDEWIAAWQDLVDFEVIPVLTSAQVQARIASSL